MKRSCFSFFLDFQHTEGLDNVCSYFPWTSFLKEVTVKVKHIREVKGTFLCFSLGNETLWLWAPEIKVILEDFYYYSTKVNTVKCYLRNFSFSAKTSQTKKQHSLSNICVCWKKFFSKVWASKTRQQQQEFQMKEPEKLSTMNFHSFISFTTPFHIYHS